MTLISCGCGKTIAAKPEWAGIQIRCAGCGRSHTLAAGAQPPPAPRDVAEPDTKACPHCAGRIKAAAIKCRLCGRMLSEPPLRVVAAPVAAAPAVDSGGVGTLLVGLLSWLFFC